MSSSITIFLFIAMTTVLVASEQNINFCKGTGFQCSECIECWPGGWCVDNAVSTAPKCLCKYGWVGRNAVYATENPGSSTEKKNLVRADACAVACHYTPFVR